MSYLLESSPQTPPLSEFPEYGILSAIGHASHMGLFNDFDDTSEFVGLARAPAIGSLGWYMNMRDSGLTDEEIHQIEEGTYNTSSDEDEDEDDTSPEHIAVTIAPPPPPLIRVKGHIHFNHDESSEEEEDTTTVRNLISEFNGMSWPSPTSTSSTSSVSSSYTNSREVRYGNPTNVELNLRNALNAAIDEWNTNLDDCHPSDGITVEELQIRNLKVERYRHLIKSSLTLLTETFGCHVCNDRRTYRGVCAFCLDQKMTFPKEIKDFVLPIKLKNN